MRYKVFKRAGVEVSSIAVGTWSIGGLGWGKVNDNDSIAAIRAMIDNGVNIVDTAPAYGEGHSEIVVGKALKDGYRDKVFLATKFAYGNYASVIKECDESLRRLAIDYIDFYFMHWPDPNTSIEETMHALEDLKKAGKIRFTGVSNYSREQIEEAEKYTRIDVLQPPYSMVNQSAKELMQWCETRGIATTTYGSLGAGILTGSIRELPHFAPDDMRYQFYDFFVEPKFSKVMELLEVLDEISDRHGKPVAQVAINWSTQKSYVGTALCGVNTPDQAKENCAAFEWSLTEGEMNMIDCELERLGL